MAPRPEDRPPDTTGAESVDPFDGPARAVAAAGDGSPSTGGEAAQEGSDDALWRSSYGYLLTQACAAARPQRPDLSDDEFTILANQAFPVLSGHGASMAADLLTFIDALRPRPAPGPPAEPRPVSRRRLRLEQALARLERAGRSAPIEEEIARACRPQVIERTVRRWLHEEPDLYDLLPWLPVPRTK